MSKRVIWKYKLEPGYITNVEMPGEAIFRHVDAQRGVACLWFEVDSDKERVMETFRVYPTGEELDPSGEYLGTFGTGSFIFHVYRGPAA